MSDLTDRIKQAQTLGTGLMLDSADVRQLKVNTPASVQMPKKNTPLNRELENYGRLLVLEGFCAVQMCPRRDSSGSCVIEKICRERNKGLNWMWAPKDAINAAYEEIIKEEVK